jgi:hypothetical protein
VDGDLLGLDADLRQSGDVMPDRPARADFGQVRRQAKELLRAARAADADALRRIRAVSDELVLASAQLAVAREYGFASWPRLKSEVLRRTVLDSVDPARLRALLDEEPELAVLATEHWRDHPMGRRRWDMWRCSAMTPRAGSGATCPARRHWRAR